LKIDLSNIAGTPGERGRYSVSERVAPTDDVSCVGPVTGEITVENAGLLLLVRGRLRGTARLTCARCLSEYRRPVEIDVEEEFATEETGPEVPTIDREEPAASGISDYVLDVSDLVRQELTVRVPMAPLCRADCLGICPQCGKNLNEGPCGCRAHPTDGRWAKLSTLLEGRSSEDSD
jgi:uncharacterized protein